MEKCIRCGKPCASGETMCDECKSWFREKTGGDVAPGFIKKETKKSEKDIDLDNTKADQEKKNTDITIQTNTESIENYNGEKNPRSKKRVIISISLIAVAALVVLFCVINHKNRTSDSNLQSNIETNESQDESLTQEIDESKLESEKNETETDTEEIAQNEENDFDEGNDSIYFVKNVETGLNMRSEPKHDSALVYTVEDRSRMEYLGENGEGYGSDNELHTWYKVSLNGHTGWVRSDLVDQDNSDTNSDAVAETVPDNGYEPFYGVWISATKSETEAENTCNDLIGKGFDALVIKTSDWSNLNPETYYAISIGAHSRKEDAETQLSVMKRNGYESAYVKYSGDYLIY